MLQNETFWVIFEHCGNVIVLQVLGCVVVYQLLVPLGNKKITNAKGVQMSRLLNLISDHSNASVHAHE